MGDEQVHIKKERGQCDICGRFGWVRAQYLGSTIVAAQCKECERNSDEV